MRRVWLTSDQHYGHARIIQHAGRPYANVEEMDAALVANHNAVVQPGDTIYHLGDFAWHDKRVEEYLAKLNGEHYLVPGNHDACHSCHRKYRKGCTAYTFAGFTILEETFEMGLGGALGNVLVSHMPTADHTDPRYPEHRPLPDEVPGRIILHGHVHEKWVVARVGGVGDRVIWQINVGVDAWQYRPVALEELQALAERLP